VLRRLLLLPLFALTAWSPNVAAEQSPLPFPAVFVDRGFLIGRSWKGDEEIERVMQNWPAYNDKQGFDDKTVLRRVTVSILGRPFDAEYRVFKNDSTQEVAVFGSDFGEDFCSALFDWAMKNLGKPAKVLEWSNSRSVRTWTETWSQKDADWAVGTGRIQIACAGLKIADEYVPALSTLIYRHETQLKPLEDLVHITCSSTKKYVGRFVERSLEESAPLNLILDPNHSKILRRDRTAFLETKKFTDEEILASKEDPKGTMLFRLDRIAGSYHWTIRLKDDKSTGIDQWGNCTRIEPGKKF